MIRDYKGCHRKFYIYLLITLGWMMVIFSLSLQSAEESSELSGGIVSYLKETVLEPVMESMGLADQMEHFIRKAAHFTEYMILGVLAALTVRETKYHKVIWPLLFGVCVACADETIQRFVPGRSGQLTDVLLDSTGVLCGVLLLLCFVGRKSLWGRVRKNV